MNRPAIHALSAAALALATAAPAAAQTVVATAGPSADCEFADLQQAIDFLSATSADRRVLRVERATFEDASLEIDADQLEIVGGFESCGDPQPGTGRSGLVAAPGLRVLSVEPGPAPRSFVRLANLRLADGFSLTGGGLQVLGAVDVVLDNTLVIGNRAVHGGGVYLADGPPELAGPATEAGGGGPTLTLLAGSGVNGNLATFDDALGGGIACRGSGRVVGLAGSGVVGNRSQDEGGGIYVEGCELRLVGPVTVSSNRAEFGGGISADRAGVLLRGTVDGPVRIINNTVEAEPSSAGGGIAITGPGAELTAENARIDDNRALPETESGGFGGGLAVFNGAVARLDRTLGADCPGAAACSSLSGNRAGGSAAAFVAATSRLEIRRTAVHANVSAMGAVVQAVGPPAALPRTELLLEGSTFVANSAAMLVRFDGKVRLDVVFSTAAGNFGLGQVIRGTDGSSDVPGEIQLAASILYEAPGTATFDLEPGIVLGADCLVVPDEAVAPGGPLDPAQVATTDDPQFVDLASRDLHLSAASPALDVCDGPPGVLSDLDLDLRGFDLPEVPDRLPGSFFDAGADEIGPPAPLFADGFERGDTTAWSKVSEPNQRVKTGGSHPSGSRYRGSPRR